MLSTSSLFTTLILQLCQAVPYRPEISGSGSESGVKALLTIQLIGA